ncbi:MAG: HEAT repeat domain-containing protein, partial [Planctomycetaceae bacterium]|nr:HEAT repeat domain-containing protein [Planctomycetaceae bacterium]
DWQRLIGELHSPNKHRRTRAQHALAHLLKDSGGRPVENGVPLNQEPLIVETLTGLLKDSLANPSEDEDKIGNEEFLARTLSSLDADDKVLPVLAEAVDAKHNIEVRKSALMAVAMISGRHFEQRTAFEATSNGSLELATALPKGVPLPEQTISDEALLQQLIASSQDPDPVVRHLAVFCFGNVSGETGIHQLKLALGDGDEKVRANAITGLARNGSADGIAELIALLESANDKFDPATSGGTTPEEVEQKRQEFLVERTKMISNLLRATADLWPAISESDRARLTEVLKSIAEANFDQHVRSVASLLLKQIESA